MDGEDYLFVHLPSSFCLDVRQKEPTSGTNIYGSLVMIVVMLWSSLLLSTSYFITIAAESLPYFVNHTYRARLNCHSQV